MLKPGPNFRLNKTAKRMIALMKGTDEQRNGWKRMFIDAQLSAEHQPKREKGKRESRGE